MRRTKPVVLPAKVASRKWLWLGSLVFVAIGLVMVAAWVGFPRKKHTITAILSETGYFEVVPPSTFGGPGTINTIEYLSNGRLELHPTCDIDPALLADKIRKSPTVDRDLKQSLEKISTCPHRSGTSCRRSPECSKLIQFTSSSRTPTFS